MGSAISLYEELVNATDERTRMRIIAEALDRLEHRAIPDGVATSAQLSETEARINANLRETELRLQKEIEQVRAESKQDIEQLRSELKQDVEHVRADMLKWGAGLFVVQGGAIIGALTAILGG
jgi:molecular chaperone GrpE (heat shock protein)